MEALLKKIKEYFKKNKLLVIILILFAPTALKGLSSYWVDFKHYILTSELERLGYNLKLEETSTFEDPTYLGFTIELDENSALFNDVLPFLEKQN